MVLREQRRLSAEAGVGGDMATGCPSPSVSARMTHSTLAVDSAVRVGLQLRALAGLRLDAVQRERRWRICSVKSSRPSGVVRTAAICSHCSGRICWTNGRRSSSGESTGSCVKTPAAWHVLANRLQPVQVPVTTDEDVAQLPGRACAPCCSQSGDGVTSCTVVLSG